MSFQNMYQEILGIAGMNLGLAKTRINEAFQKIQNENVFSFQCFTGGWLTANLLEFHSPTFFPETFSGNDRFRFPHRRGSEGQFLSPGTITVVPFTNTITGDAVATAAWTQTVPYPPLLTQQQIRVPSFSLYNIIGLGNNGTVAYATVLTPGSGQTPGTYTLPILDPAAGAGATISVTVNADGTVTLPPITLTAGTGYTTPNITFSEGGTPATFSVTLIATLTIDRPWSEPPMLRGPYMIYQAYYPAPPNFKRWYNVRDTQNNQVMDWYSMTQIDLAEIDPQREIFDQPEFVVPLGIDTRAGSATYGQWLIELWPHPISTLSYTFMCQCNWPALALPTDTVPFPLTDEIVKERAYEMVALFKEASKGDEMERGSGANWQFLAKAHHEEYKDLLRQARIMDRHLVDLYFTKARMNAPLEGQPDSYTGNQANVGW